MSAVVQRLSQSQRSARTRERLIQAAIEALFRFGYAATSTTLVAEMAGVSRGAMVHQFSTKVTLMSAVASATYDADLRAYAAATANLPDPIDRACALFDAAWAQFSAPGGVAQTEIWMATRSDPELAAVVIPLHDEMSRQTRLGHANLLAAAGLRDRGISDAMMALNIAALRGLALERALGIEPEVLQRALQMLRENFLNVFQNDRMR